MPIKEIHNSHLRAFRRCTQQFKYKYIDNLQAKRPSLPLAKGIWLHYCLATQYLRWGLEDGTLLLTPQSLPVDGVGDVRFFEGETSDKNDNEVSGGWYLEVRVPDEEWAEEGIEPPSSVYPLSAAGMLQLLAEQVWSRLMPEEQEKYSEDGYSLPETCKVVLEEYFWHYREELSPRNFEVLLVETDWQREYEGETYEGRIDYVVSRKGMVVVGDWKTTKSRPTGEFKLMESQLHLYPWGIEETLAEHDLKVDAVEFDYIYSKPPTKPSQNKDGSLSARKINTTERTLRKALKEYGLRWTDQEIEQYMETNGGDFYVRKPMPRKKSVTNKLMQENHVDTERIRVLEQDPEFYATRTVTRDCHWDCEFSAVCKGDLYGEDVRHLIKKEFETRTDSRGTEVDYEDED